MTVAVIWERGESVVRCCNSSAESIIIFRSLSRDLAREHKFKANGSRIKLYSKAHFELGHKFNQAGIVG